MSHLPDDPDYFTKVQSATKKVYRGVYPAIDPSSPELSQAGKVVVITGASRGLGKNAFAASFAKAGAKALVLAARKRESLKETEEMVKKINPNVETLLVEVDMKKEETVKTAFDEVKQRFGTVDVLVNNAGVGGGEGLIKDSPMSDLWDVIETNGKGEFLVVQHFLRVLGDKEGVMVNLTSGAALMVIPTLAAYGISKLINLRMNEFLASENPKVASIALHPGIVMTDMTTDMFKKYAKDSPELVGGAAVWLSTPAARFMSGRYMTSNWNVQELVAKKEEIVSKNQLTVQLTGDFQFGEVA